MVDSETNVGSGVERSPYLGRDAWIEDAVCRNSLIDVEWFPEVYAAVGTVVYERHKLKLEAICRACPAAGPCLEEALAVPAAQDGFGVRAGTDQRERDAIRRRRQQ